MSQNLHLRDVLEPPDPEGLLSGLEAGHTPRGAQTGVVTTKAERSNRSVTRQQEHKYRGRATPAAAGGSLVAAPYSRSEAILGFDPVMSSAESKPQIC